MKILGPQGFSYNISKGHVAELKFVLLAWHECWQVAKPLFDVAPYDFVVRGLDGYTRWLTVQVKQAFLYRGYFRLDIRKTNNGQYKKNDYDYLFGFLPQREVWYKIPYDEISHIKHELRIESSKYSRFKFEI